MSWIQQNNTLSKDFKFKDFAEALDFIVRVGRVAEAQNHHPKIINEYNKVRLELCTHSAGYIVTDKDWELAKGIDGL